MLFLSKFNEHAFPVCSGIWRSKGPGRARRCRRTNLAGLRPTKCKEEEIKRLRNQSINEARHSLRAQSISPLRRRTRASNDLPASLLRPTMEVDTGNNTHLASSLSDKQRRGAAADLPLKKLTQPLRKMKANPFEPSGQFPISSRRQFDIVRTHQACL